MVSSSATRLELSHVCPLSSLLGLSQRAAGLSARPAGSSPLSTGLSRMSTLETSYANNEEKKFTTNEVYPRTKRKPASRRLRKQHTVSFVFHYETGALACLSTSRQSTVIGFVTESSRVFCTSSEVVATIDGVVSNVDTRRFTFVLFAKKRSQTRNGRRGSPTSLVMNSSFHSRHEPLPQTPYSYYIKKSRRSETEETAARPPELEKKKGSDNLACRVAWCMAWGRGTNCHGNRLLEVRARLREKIAQSELPRASLNLMDHLNAVPSTIIVSKPVPAT